MAPKPIIERNWQITFNKSNCSGWVDQLKGVHSYSFIWYSNGVLAWDFPERVPEYVKNRIYKELMKLKKQAKTKKSRTQAKAGIDFYRERSPITGADDGPRMKCFDGRYFFAEGAHFTKKQAQSRADKLSETGCKYRIVREKGSVYGINRNYIYALYILPFR